MKNDRRWVPAFAGMTRWAVCALVLLLLNGCSGSSDKPKGETGLTPTMPLKVTVCVTPQLFLMERIGGEFVIASTLVQPGQEPHTYEPTPHQITLLNESDLFITVAMPFAQRIAEQVRKMDSKVRIVSADAVVMKQQADPDHHEGAPVESKEIDPHTWTGASALRIQAVVTAQTLAELDPSHTAFYATNLHSLLTEIDSIDSVIREKLAPYKGAAFYIYHPALGYFAQEYGLKQVGIEFEGKSPSPRQLNDLIQRARDEKIKVIFVAPQYDDKYAMEMARAIKGRVAILDPMAKDITGNWTIIAEQMRLALEGR